MKKNYCPAKASAIAFNCIDPSIRVNTNGTVWMSFGSYSEGIVVTQIDPTTGLRINPAAIGTKIASGTATCDQNTAEGSCCYQRGGNYYLFLNCGGCWTGVNCPYNIRVERSTSLTGPCLDKGGANMLASGGTMVLEGTARYIGPGHPASMSDKGTNRFTCHYYDGENNGNAT